jgi:ribose 5-phosphate isomerase A
MSTPPTPADQRKALVARAAIEHLVPGELVGVGTGSTVTFFIDELARMPVRIPGAVSSSERSTALLRKYGIPVLDANEVERLAVYVDGADEIDPRGYMTKGGGAALTREKIVADLAERFVCIADDSKCVAHLGRFPIPIEVIPMAAAQITRRFARIGGRAVLRTGVVTDNGGHLIDVHGLTVEDPLALELEVDTWPGVVTIGIFARNKASIALLGTADGVKTVTY